MTPQTSKIIRKLGSLMLSLPQPINLIAVCTGGTTVAKNLNSYLKSKGLKSKFYSIWINHSSGKASIWKSNFKEKNYKGSSVIVEDVIWKGTAIPAIKKYLKKLNTKNKPYVASILDCNKKADFSVIH